MTITAKVIADSISNEGIRLTTVQLRYPRFIHAELMTHRVFSRNASSSRAIPVDRLIQDIIDDTAMPIHWGKNQKGMQADEECDALVEVTAPKYIQYDDIGEGSKFFTNKETWFEARDEAIRYAKSFNNAGYHKQIVNRLLEPFSHINVIVTSTEWDNFFELRDHKDAQPEIMVLAQQIMQAMEVSETKILQHGEYHLPYVNWMEIDQRSRNNKEEDLERAIKCSIARCARVSYKTHDGKEPLLEDDLKLYDRLLAGVPLHASPSEHVATPDRLIGFYEKSWENKKYHGNFTGWIQQRKIIEERVWDNIIPFKQVIWVYDADGVCSGTNMLPRKVIVNKDRNENQEKK